STSRTYSLSLHDALPILLAFVEFVCDWRTLHALALAGMPQGRADANAKRPQTPGKPISDAHNLATSQVVLIALPMIASLPFAQRSEEHTSELQSRENLVC